MSRPVPVEAIDRTQNHEESKMKARSKQSLVSQNPSESMQELASGAALNEAVKHCFSNTRMPLALPQH